MGIPVSRRKTINSKQTFCFRNGWILNSYWWRHISDNDDICCHRNIEEGSCAQERYILDQTGRTLHWHKNPDFILPKEMERWFTKKSSIFHLRLFSVLSVFRRIWLTKVAEQGHLSGRATVAATKVWLLAKVALQSWERGGLQMIWGRPAMPPLVWGEGPHWAHRGRQILP